MRLRLAVVAVALLVSFGVQARDFDISGNVYIGNIIKQLNAEVVVSSCSRIEESEDCIYGINNNAGITITNNGDTGKIHYLEIFCLKESCRPADLIRVLMKSSPMLSRYVTGWKDGESWESLIKQKREVRGQINRKNADLGVDVGITSAGNQISVFVYLPMDQ